MLAQTPAFHTVASAPAPVAQKTPIHGTVVAKIRDLSLRISEDLGALQHLVRVLEESILMEKIYE